MALLNINNLKTLVAIGDINKRKKFICHATGFIVGFIAQNSKDPIKRSYYLFLITNRHVFEERNYVYLRFNKKDGNTEIFQQGLFFPNKEPRWLSHRNTNVDLAILNVSPKILGERNVDFSVFTEEMFAYYKNFKKIGIEVGDEVYVLGFPLGLAGKVQNFPSVKSGIISRLDKEVIKKNKSFWIDSSIFPGSSGSPVILKPTIHSLRGTPAISQVYLLGVVSGHIPYEERLYSLQTKPPSVVSLERENSGLSFVVPMDFARQIFRNWKLEKKKLEKAQKQLQQGQKEVRSILR